MTSGDVENAARVHHSAPGTRDSLICVRNVLKHHDVLLGHGPSLRHLRRDMSPLTLFGGFAGTMPMFDSSPACMPGLCFWLPGPIRWPVGPGCWRGLSVLARVVSRRAYGSWTTLGLPRTSRYIVRNSVAFPLGALGLRHRLRFSKLISSPADASIYASPGPSRCPAQDSRSRWFRYSFLVGLFHPRLHAGLSRRLRSLTVAAQ